MRFQSLPTILGREQIGASTVTRVTSRDAISIARILDSTATNPSIFTESDYYDCKLRQLCPTQSSLRQSFANKGRIRAYATARVDTDPSQKRVFRPDRGEPSVAPSREDI